jgi:hypothetical protein
MDAVVMSVSREASFSGHVHIERMTFVAVALGSNVNVMAGGAANRSDVRLRVRIGRIASRLGYQRRNRPMTIEAGRCIGRGRWRLLGVASCARNAGR